MFCDFASPKAVTMTREELREYHLYHLQRLLERVYANSAFYRKLWANAGLHPEHIKTLDDFTRLVPMVTKQDFLADQNSSPPYGQRLAVSEEEICQVHLTSGTSGIGQEVYALTRDDISLEAQGWVIHLRSIGLKPGDVSIVTWPVATMAAALNVYEACREIGVNAFLVGIYDGETKIKLMQRFDMNHLVATPTYVSRLAVLCQEMGLNPSQAFGNLKAISVAAESYPANWLEEMEAVWGCPIHDVYGSTQNATALGMTCQTRRSAGEGGGTRRNMHLFEHLTFVEAIDYESGEPVSYGAEGELVLTPLFRQATPVIRFRTGDKVILYPGQTCSCGSQFDFLEAGTIARFDDMIKIKAANVWPQTVDDIIFSYKEVEEYNGVVSIDEKGRENVRVLLEFRDGVPEGTKASLMKQVGERIRQKTQVTMIVEEVPRGTLERTLFKSRRWVDRRQEGLRQVVRYLEK
ncbi:MAG: phenylacetate--CoA ligase family protein [Clostridia bacterium]|nr:MAG: phenylacetate--CoA ligase family protein [Clostridia bacterium]